MYSKEDLLNENIYRSIPFLSGWDDVKALWEL